MKIKFIQTLLCIGLVFSLAGSSNALAARGHHHHGHHGYYGHHWQGNHGVNPWAIGGLILGIGAGLSGGYGPYYGYNPYYGPGPYYGPNPYYGGYAPYYGPRVYYGYTYRCRTIRGHYDPYGYWIPRQRVCW